MIYLDHNSTTPLEPRVLAKMLPFLNDSFGNPSSREHAFGWDAREAVEEARSEVAALVNARQNEIVFTSGATESLALALYGLFDRYDRFPGTEINSSGIITSQVEHEAVLSVCRDLQVRGRPTGSWSVPVEYLSVDAQGRLDIRDLEAALVRLRPKGVCLMAANNETGVLFPVRECAALAHAHGSLFLTDATQALGKVPLDAQADGFDLAAFSAHKLNGPKGIGALFIRGGRESIPLKPLLPGGGQEGGLRGGTLNVPAIVGFGEACRLAGLEMDGDNARIGKMRNALERALQERFPAVRVNGSGEPRLANTANLLFPGIDARSFIRDMHEVAVSTRSACSSGSSEASHVLKAMGLSEEQAFASVRFSLGPSTSEAEIERTVEIVSASYRKLRATAGEG